MSPVMNIFSLVNKLTLALANKLSMANVPVVNKLSIGNRLTIFAAGMLVVLAATNLYLKSEISAANDALGEQARITEELNSATNALRAFGEQKYWLTDLAVSWLTESEENADKSGEKLAAILQSMSAAHPEKVNKITALVENVAEKSLEAVDAYVDNNRVLGNSILSQARDNIVAIDKILVEQAGVLRAKFKATQKKAAEKEAAVARITFLVIVLAAAFSALLTWIIVASISGQLKGLTQVMSVLAEGNHGVDVIGAGRSDEIGKMAQAIQVFKDNAIDRERLEGEAKEQRERAEIEREDRQRKETEAEAERSVALNQLADSFEAQVMGVVEKVANSATDMADAADNMVQRTEEAQEQSSSVSAAAEQASNNVQTVAAAAEELSKSIAENSQQVTKSAAISSEAVSNAQTTNAQVQSLAEAANKIGRVVELINNIAGQTNLLALNATIEAARAGDAGKGFAVVASEVGNLATQTAKATEEIEMQISGIQSATEDSVHAIDGITKTIGEINEITTSIAAAVEEQGKATQEIARNVDQASNGTQEVTNSITSVASAVAATGQAAGKVQTSATGLTEQSENLAGAVQHFLAKVRTGTDAIDLVEADPDTVDTDAVNPAAVATDEIDSMAA